MVNDPSRMLSVNVAARESGSFDVILMDLQMPVMDGIEATAAIRDYERSTDAARIPVEFETVLCENLVRCGQMPDLATCQASTFLDEDPEAAQLIADIEDGIIDYDGEAAQDCLDAFRGQQCQGFGGCLDGNFCRLDVSTGISTCIRLPGEGEACDPNLQLVACVRQDNFCDPTDSICKPRLAPGEACDAEVDRCALYAACDGAVCQARPVQGEPCRPEAEECLGDLTCTNSVCAAPEFEAVCNSDSAS